MWQTNETCVGIDFKTLAQVCGVVNAAPKHKTFHKQTIEDMFKTVYIEKVLDMDGELPR